MASSGDRGIGRWLVVLGAVNGALVVALGAYGAHALKNSADYGALFDTAVRYHMFHALGLVALGAVAVPRARTMLFAVAGAVMLLGIVLFCGSLYVAALTGERTSAWLAPVGGVAFIVAWIVFAVAVFRR